MQPKARAPPPAKIRSAVPRKPPRRPKSRSPIAPRSFAAPLANFSSGPLWRLGISDYEFIWTTVEGKVQLVRYPAGSSTTSSRERGRAS